MPPCERWLVSRSSRKATVAKTVFVVGDCGQVLCWLGVNLNMQYIIGTTVSKGAEKWLCVEQSCELFSEIRERGGTSNACFQS